MDPGETSETYRDSAIFELVPRSARIAAIALVSLLAVGWIVATIVMVKA